MRFRRVTHARARRNGVLHAFAYIVLFVGTARAGHAPLVPEPRTISIRQDHPDHVVVGTRRGGYFITRDAGQTWSWMCEAGIGYEDEEVYPGAFLSSGALVLSTGFGGAAVSPDGCGWSQWLPSPNPFLADVRVRPDAKDVVVALDARPDGEAFANRLWQSADDGKTWQALGDSFSPGAHAVSFAVSNRGDFYVATVGPLGAELLQRQDSSADWKRTLISGELGVTPRVIGAHGTTSASTHVYLVLDHAQLDGVDGPGDRVLLSLDGGDTFTSLLDGAGDLSAWSLSPDGERLAVGGHSDGIHVLTHATNAAADSLPQQVNAKATHALAWDGRGRLYAAGHEAADGYSVGISDDDGRTFSKLFALCQVDGPLACSVATSIGALCSSSGETGWDVRKEVADEGACAPGAAGASSGPASEADPLPHDHEPLPEVDTQRGPRSGSCAASTGRQTQGSPALIAMAALAVALRPAMARARKRRR